MLLKDKYKQMLLDIFSGLPIPAEVWAYGSRVKGSAHDGSDLDLVILTPDRQKLPIDTLMKLKEKIRESNIPILVELFDWARLPESFHKNIEACHEVIYSSALNIIREPDAPYSAKADNDTKE
jgi:predicted nucleotidyltransferase